MSEPTITEFLEARIAEDEAAVQRRGGSYQHSWHGYDIAGTYNPGCPDCLGLVGTERVLAECAAKRAIIELADHALATEVERRDAPALGAGLMHSDVICRLAAVYKDHPDYREEWA